MDATRVRFVPLLEWACAAVLVIGGVAVAMLGVRDVRPANAVNIVPTTAVMAHEAPVPDPPMVLPPGAVAVPMLPVDGGHTIRVGERAAQVRASLAGRQRGTDALDRDGTRERVTRFYDLSGTRVAIVFEAPRAGAEPLVVAIYR